MLHNTQAFRALLPLLAGCAVLGGASLSACGDSCNELDPSECADNDCATIRGRPFDSEAQCLGEARPVACMSAQVCGAAATEAVDHEGRRWHFSNTCTPDGWGDAGQVDSQALPNCED
jgi:hypothetical protein